MTLLEPADWSFPVPIRFGPGRLAELAEVCAAAGMRAPLVVTDRGSRDLPFIEQAMTSLSSAGLFSDISPNPTDADIANGRSVFREGGHDGVVAIGGGSGMDGGKAISLVAANETDLWSFDYDHGVSPALQSKSLVPLVTVPTTAGTGAETESTAMVTDLDRGVKRCVWHADHRPVASILDPEVTVGLPATLTAWTGVDALVHAIEALSVPDFHPLCDGIAQESLRLISAHLVPACNDGTNLEARAGMLVGSCLGGIAFLKGLGLVHAMSHMVGAVHDTHHGLTNAILLPPVLIWNRAALGNKVELMNQALGVDGTGFDALYGHITGLLDTLEIPTNLAAIGVEAGRIREIAEKAHTDAAASTNPTPATIDEIEAMLSEALTSARG